MRRLTRLAGCCLIATSLIAGAASWSPVKASGTGFVDSFGTAVDSDPGYGLNDSLAARQTLGSGVTYTRVSGLWYPAPSPRPWYSQVNHPNRPGALSFWLGTSAVRMDAPVIPDETGTISVRATVDPVNGDVASGDWSSLVLGRDPNASGYVTNPDVALGVIVRSNGGVQVFQDGAVILSKNGFAQPDADGRFHVTVSYSPGQRSASLSVNGSAATLSVNDALPGSATLFMGAYLTSGNETSTLSDLGVSAVDRTGLTVAPGSSLRYYGYYAARLAGDSHLAEVAGRSNLNWVNVSDVDRYRPEVLDGCAANSCVVNTGNEFFSCDSTGNNCHLYPDYADRWARLASAVRSRLGKVAAFYILDEPQWRGATSAEIATSAELIKKTFPGTHVMMIEAGPAVTPSYVVPASADWIGFDWYCRPFGDVEQTLGTLESRATAGQGLFLVPEGAPLAECGGAGGHKTDADIASLQWSYLHLAEQHPRVIGLMNFGFWTAPAWTGGGHGASDLPLTVDADERIAARVMAPRSTG